MVTCCYNAQTILRSNYGVSFTITFALDNSMTKWTHIFVIPIDKLRTNHAQHPQYCPNGRDTIDKMENGTEVRWPGCDYYWESTYAYSLFKNESVQTINNIVTSIKKLLPTGRTVNRVKRGLFDLVGNYSINFSG